MNIKENELTISLKMTIADFLQEEKKGFELLKLFGIPTEGNEHKTLMEVCTARKLNEDEVIKEIKRLKNGSEFDYPEDIFSWTPERVIRYLEEKHHPYTCSLIRDAEDYGERAWGVHGIQYPKLNQVKTFVQELKVKLETHLDFKEQKVHPLLLRFFDMNDETKDETVQTLKKQVGIIEENQEEIENFLKRIRDLSKNFNPPEEACTTFRLLYFTLRKLDEDLAEHLLPEEHYVLSKLKTKLENS